MSNVDLLFCSLGRHSDSEISSRQEYNNEVFEHEPNDFYPGSTSIMSDCSSLLPGSTPRKTVRNDIGFTPVSAKVGIIVYLLFDKVFIFRCFIECSTGQSPIF